jgi:replication factor C subunit 1
MASVPLDGYVFVFTGNMSIERDEARDRALLLGARVTVAVSSRTTHLVTGADPGPSKVQKAQELGAKIIDEDEFMSIIGKYKSGMEKNISTVTQPKDDGSVPAHKTSVESSRAAQYNALPWAEKYRPQTVEDLVGNRSVVDQLNSFVLGESGFKAAFVSGPPGVGKTTAALAVCRMNGITPIEFNASDVRSKKNIVEHISGLVNNFVVSRDMKTGKKVVIMDEIDGMTSDRGGIPELVNVIKKARVPIICICNDKTHVKMRTLASHCLSLHFRKLDARSILPRARDILEMEGKCLSDGILNDIAANSTGTCGMFSTPSKALSAEAR